MTSLLRLILISGWAISGLIALSVILSIVILAILNRPVPDVLVNYGGVIIGFFFGQFASFVKDATLPSSTNNEVKSKETDSPVEKK